MTEVRDLAELQLAIAGGECEIAVVNRICITEPVFIEYAVRFRGEPDASLVWMKPTAACPSLFTIASGGDLSIESLILDAGGRDGTLVHISGGRLTMNGGTVLRNVRSAGANSAVKIGGVASQAGGVFMMNGGLITGNDAEEAVLCTGGTVVMNNGAAISGNRAAGIALSQTLGGRKRASLTMTGRARISDNEAKKPGGAGIAIGADIIMGVEEGDAPAVTGNRSLHSCGGWFLTEKSTLTMHHNAEISENHAVRFAGSIGAMGSLISMTGRASVRGNTSEGDAGGMMLSANCVATVADRAEIAGNISSGRGGGVYLQKGAALQVGGEAAIHDNTAADGGGIYLNAATASLGLANASPVVFQNRAEEKGGGVFIAAGSTLHLSGRAKFSENTAAQGAGIYKEGCLNVSQAIRVLDGLCLADSPHGEERFGHNDDIPDLMTTDAACGHSGAPPKRAKCGPVPIIADTLTADARIQLESSQYVSPANVPVTVAENGGGRTPLWKTNRDAWLIPRDFHPRHTVVFSDARDQVRIIAGAFAIEYHGLHGAENPNPLSYAATGLPITLNPPGVREGYTFCGWHDSEGKPISKIPVRTTGDIVLTAVWEAFFVTFHANGRDVRNLPDAIPVRCGETVSIPDAMPRRRGFHFVCWSTSATKLGAVYAPGDTVHISDKSIGLYARWQGSSCCCTRRVPGKGRSRADQDE